MIQQMLAIWSMVPLPFLKPAWTSGSSWFRYIEAWLENFEHYFASMWDECNCAEFEHSLALSFFGIGMKTDLFHSCGHCWVFQIFWHIECSTFTVLSFRIWNSSTGIPSPPLALFIVILPKAHLTSFFLKSQFYLFILLYNIVLVLPYIDMNLPWMYLCSPPCTLLPLPSPSHPSGSSPCTSPEHPVSRIEPGLVMFHIW